MKSAATVLAAIIAWMVACAMTAAPADAKRLDLSLAQKHTAVAIIHACDVDRREAARHDVHATCAGFTAGPCRYVIPWISRVSCHAEYDLLVRGWSKYKFCTTRMYWKWSTDGREVVAYKPVKWRCTAEARSARSSWGLGAATQRIARTSTAMLRFLVKADGDAYTQCMRMRRWIHPPDPIPPILSRSCEGWSATCRRAPWPRRGGPRNPDNAYCHLHAFADDALHGRQTCDRWARYASLPFSGTIRLVSRSSTAWLCSGDQV